MRRAFLRRGTPPEAIPIMMASLSDSTVSQYNICYKQWWQFCATKFCDPLNYDRKILLSYLSDLFNKGTSYSMLNTHRSALALILAWQSEDAAIVKRFLKGVFQIKPPKPKYSVTWDPDSVFHYLKTLSPLTSLSLENLSYKLVMLLALASGHRVQTLSKIRLENITYSSNRIEIKIPDKIKTSGPKKLQPNLIFPYFENAPELCVGSTIEFYIQKTQEFRPTLESDQLILTFKKPIHPASSQTISRWLKTVLKRSGINTTIFTAHSTRHAATSAAHRKGVHIDTIRNTAGWSESSSVFYTFYNRPVPPPTDASQFARAVLLA